MVYEESKDKAQIGDFTPFENGRTSSVQSFNDILDDHDFVRIINYVKGERLEIYSHESGKLLYHGELNEKRERE